jgi:hypothetical protein
MQTEPYAARMQTMRESWTDERLDDLNDRVSDGFQRLDGEIKDLRREMNTRFDALQWTLFQGMVALSTALVVGFLGLIATQL